MSSSSNKYKIPSQNLLINESWWMANEPMPKRLDSASGVVSHVVVVLHPNKFLLANICCCLAQGRYRVAQQYSEQPMVVDMGMNPLAARIIHGDQHAGHRIVQLSPRPLFATTRTRHQHAHQGWRWISRAGIWRVFLLIWYQTAQ